MISKIDPRGDTFDQKGSKNLRPLPTGPFLESTFFRAACFLCFLIHFRRPFSQCWALLAPFGLFWGPCWPLLAPFWQLFGRSWLIFARNKKNLESIFAGGFFTKNLVAKRKKKANSPPTPKLRRPSQSDRASQYTTPHALLEGRRVGRSPIN